MDPREEQNAERSAINGRIFPLEDYGTLRSPTDDDRVHILEDDELVCDLYNQYLNL